MSSRFWPKDPLGNEIRKGALVAIASSQPTILRVVDVVEAGLLPQEDGQPPMVKDGHITLLMQLPYSPANTQIPIAVVLKEPEASRIHKV